MSISSQFILFFIFDIIFQKYMAVQYVEWGQQFICVKWSGLIMTVQVCHTVSSQTTYQLNFQCTIRVHMYVRIIWYRRITLSHWFMITSFRNKYKTRTSQYKIYSSVTMVTVCKKNKKQQLYSWKRHKNVDLIELSQYKSGQMLPWIPINIKLEHSKLYLKSALYVQINK